MIIILLQCYTNKPYLYNIIYYYITSLYILIFIFTIFHLKPNAQHNEQIIITTALALESIFTFVLLEP